MPNRSHHAKRQQHHHATKPPQGAGLRMLDALTGRQVAKAIAAGPRRTDPPAGDLDLELGYGSSQDDKLRLSDRPRGRAK